MDINRVKTHLRRASFLLLALALLAAPQPFSPTPDMYRALASISPDSLRGNLSFLASDLLEGRGTPSRGLDIAAEFIAAQFRSAGLEPAGDDGYFQTAKMLRVGQVANGFELSVHDGARAVEVPRNRVAVVSRQPLELSGAPVYKARNAADLKAADLRGQVLMLGSPRGEFRELAKAAVALKPAAFLETEEDGGEQLGPSLIDPDEEQEWFGGIPRLILRGGEAAKALRSAKAGPTDLTVSIKLTAPAAEPVTIRNVIGLLRGSDPALRDQYILVTAHYDHLGREGPDAIFHGANDDGSGTVSVIEIGKALATLPVRPRRSIVFMTFFGEEEGSYGSRYYARHPVFPLDKTVADLNLEQLGRTDSSAGKEISNASLTGFEFSNVARTLQQAGELTGVKVYEAANGDEFFERSDNETFAEHGIPAHTIVVAFEYPDYHAVGDVWQKIDYDNMAKVDRMIALGTIMLAENPEAPRWNRANPNATRFMQAK
jgi:hypothetical protein